MSRTPKFPRLLRILWVTAIGIPDNTQRACPQMQRACATRCPEGTRQVAIPERPQLRGAMPGVREIRMQPTLDGRGAIPLRNSTLPSA